MQKSVLISLIIVTISVPLSLLFAGSEWEYWNSYQANLEVKNNFVVSLAPEFRFQDDLDNYYTHIDLGIEWKIRQWVSLSAKYRHIITRQDDDRNREYRPYIDIKFMPSFITFGLINRSRMEWRIRNNNDSFRYRNQTSIKFPTLTLLPIRPYFAEEFFYDFKVDRINRNRIYTGVEFFPVQKFGAIASYILESNKGESKWLDTNLLKLDLKYNIN